MRVVFAGTPEFALSSLNALIRHPDTEVVAVYTQPDRRAGRGKKMQGSPIKASALDHGIAVYQPLSLKQPEAIESLRALAPDLMVVTAYGLLLPQSVLEIPKYGCINVHGSLLPKWRGAAPIQRAIEAGDTKTGITLMQMDAGLDTGPMLAKVEVDIADDETGGSLHDKLAVAGEKLLFDSLASVFAGSIKGVPQEHHLASYAEKISKDDGRIQWRHSAEQILRTKRALQPWVIVSSDLQGLKLGIHQADVDTECTPNSAQQSTLPGEVLDVSKQGIKVATGDSNVILRTVQKPGGKPMAVKDFLNGVAITPGMCFG